MAVCTQYTAPEPTQERKKIMGREEERGKRRGRGIREGGRREEEGKEDNKKRGRTEK